MLSSTTNKMPVTCKYPGLGGSPGKLTFFTENIRILDNWLDKRVSGVDNISHGHTFTSRSSYCDTTTTTVVKFIQSPHDAFIIALHDHRHPSTL